MKMTLSKIQHELRRLSSGDADDNPEGLGVVRFIARCPVGAVDVLERVKSVLRIVDEKTLDGLFAELPHALPEWFVQACAPPMSTKQAEEWLAWWRAQPISEQARIEAEQDWTLDNWLYWMAPENRQWFWWDAIILEDCDHILIATEVVSWPFPWDALRWLFKASGASDFTAEA